MSASADFDKYPDRIAELFENRTVLLTGGTGFVGKVLVEKLLRSCSNLKKIYFIIRNKRNKNPSERLSALMDDPLFDLVKKQNGANVVNKVEAIAGDIKSPGMALSKDDRDKVTGEVEIIFHSAATVRFDEPLKNAVLMNVGGTKAVLNLAKECRKLLVIVHLSTAYTHPHENVLYEKMYPPPSDPHLLLDIAEKRTHNDIENISKVMLGSYPNTYSYTKALGESLVEEQMDNLPIILMRLSVVVPIWKEPIPGWTDNFNGPVGICLAGAKGLSKTAIVNGDICGDFIPVDITVNAVLAGTFDYVTNKQRRIFNVANLLDHKVSYSGIHNLAVKVTTTKVPLNNVFWYPKNLLTKHKLYYDVHFYLFQMFPAVCIDAVLMLTGFKPFLVDIQKRIDKGVSLLEFYCINEWVFDNSALVKVRSLLNPKEREIYRTDCHGINCEKYFTNCAYSIRQYLLKESNDTMPAAKRHMKLMWFIDRLTTVLFVIGLPYFLWKSVIKKFLTYRIEDNFYKILGRGL